MNVGAITPYLVHAGYATMLCAFLARDVLWLRALLTAAQTLLAIYAWQVSIPSIAGWNVAFAAINVTWVAQILRERRAVALPGDLQPIYARHFAALTPPEFLRLWRQGRRETFRDRRLASAGEFPDSLYFLLRGTVRVSRGGRPITDLPTGHFVAEMSLLTGNPANADVDAVGDVEAVRWSIDDLRTLRQKNPLLWTKVQSVIGLDLVAKVRRTEGGEDGVRS